MPSRRRQVLALLLLLGWRYEARAQLAPQRLAAVDLPAGARALDVAVSPLRAYVLAKRKHGLSALYVLDTTVPAAPAVIGTLSIDRPASRLVASHGAGSARLYVGTRGSPSELLVVDVSDAAKPTLVSAVPVGRAVTALALHGDRLYVGTRNDRRSDGRELRVLDASAPEQPAARSAIEVGVHVNDLAVAEGMLAVATSDDAREVVLFDASGGAAPVEASAIDLPGKADAVAVAIEAPATLAVVTDGGAPDFRLFHLSGASPISRGTASLRTRGARVALRGDWAWVTSRRRDGGLRLLNLSHFSHPRLQRTYEARGTVGLAVDAPYAYLASRDPKADVEVVDAALPAEIVSTTGEAGQDVLRASRIWTWMPRERSRISCATPHDILPRRMPLRTTLAKRRTLRSARATRRWSVPLPATSSSRAVRESRLSSAARVVPPSGSTPASRTMVSRASSPMRAASGGS
jgi:hypothetical protein